jgi:hypothetical protein
MKTSHRNGFRRKVHEKATVQITYDAEKLGAIRQSMGKKGSPPPQTYAPNEDFLQKLYEKHVPAPAGIN